MPFTPSHAIVALPFVRTPLIPAAIAVGAMTPDLPLFVRGTPLTYAFTHTPENIVWTMLIAFVLFVTWWVLLRPAAGDLVPAPVRRRLPQSWWLSPALALREVVGVGQSRGHLPLVVVSLLVGVLSHIVWDAFTHEGRWGLVIAPALAEQWGPLPGYKWLQYCSGIGGVAVIVVWAMIWLLRREPIATPPSPLPRVVVIVWIAALPVTLGIAAVIGYQQRGPFSAAFTPQHLAYALLPPAAAIWGLLTLVLCAGIVASRQRTGAPFGVRAQGNKR